MDGKSPHIHHLTAVWWASWAAPARRRADASFCSRQVVRGGHRMIEPSRVWRAAACLFFWIVMSASTWRLPLRSVSILSNNNQIPKREDDGIPDCLTLGDRLHSAQTEFMMVGQARCDVARYRRHAWSISRPPFLLMSRGNLLFMQSHPRRHQAADKKKDG